jgi:hypothetical protein
MTRVQFLHIYPYCRNLLEGVSNNPNGSKSYVHICQTSLLPVPCCRTVQPMQAAGAGLPRATMPRLEELSHPLLGDAPTLQLMPPPTDIPGAFRSTSGL